MTQTNPGQHAGRITPGPDADAAIHRLACSSANLSGPEHLAMSLWLTSRALKATEELDEGTATPYARFRIEVDLSAAKVHALAAQTAATALPPMRRTVNEVAAWERSVGIRKA